MFGNRKEKGAAKGGAQYCRIMFAGLDSLHGRPVPNQAFSDAYVYGFLQQLCVLAALEVYGRPKSPEVLAAITAAAFDELVPGYGLDIVRAAAGIADANHPLHQNYSVGSLDGKGYVNAVIIRDLINQNAVMKDFRDFIVRVYLLAPPSSTSKGLLKSLRADPGSSDS